VRNAPRALLAIALLLPTGEAQAGLLSRATWLQVVQGVPMTRSTTQLGATGSSTASSVAAALRYPAFSTMFFVPRT